MSNDSPLTPAQKGDLRAIAGVIIPASAEFDVPGADDPLIQADIVATLGRDAGRVREALDELARLAGRPLADLDPPRRDAVAMELRATGGAAVATLTRVVLHAIIAMTASSVLSDWSRGRPIQRVMYWKTATGHCSTRSEHGRRCGAGPSLREILGGEGACALAR
jgi:hypothetical protein